MLSRLLGSRTPTREAIIARGAVRDVGAVVRRVGMDGRLLLVADPTTWTVAGAAVSASLEAAGLAVQRHILEDDPIAGPDGVAAVQAAAAGADGLVAVGSGTVNDITKSAADGLGKPYVVAGTALSMNGYTSAISALLEGGIKRTLPAGPPLAVVLDLDVCASAPPEMTRSGLGDMLSKPLSEADWRLSHQVDGVPYSDEPGAVLEDAFGRMLSAAGAIGRGEPDALASLAESLLLSGIAMAMAGSSSPASGGEHLLSHYWDMHRYAVGAHPYGLHGTQVGVACCLVDPLHQTVQRLASVDVDAALRGWPEDAAALEAQVRSRHTGLPAWVVDGIVAEAVKTWRPPAEQRTRVARIARRLPEILHAVRGALLPAGAIEGALEAAGAPTRPETIHPDLRGGLDRWICARDIRARYSILDFAIELGVGP